MFDLDCASPMQSALGMAVVALAAFATAWTLLATTWNAIVNAPARFGLHPVPGVSFPIHWPERELLPHRHSRPVAGLVKCRRER